MAARECLDQAPKATPPRQQFDQGRPALRRRPPQPNVQELQAPRRDNFHFGAAVYGSFLVAAVVGAAFETGQDARVMTMTAFASALVYWLAHWWSEVIGEQISAGEAFRHRDVLVVARREWPLVEAAVVPTLLLALAWAGVWSRETGARLALAAAVLQITGWALVAGRRAGWTWPRAGLFAAVDGALGIVLLLLAQLVH